VAAPQTEKEKIDNGKKPLLIVQVVQKKSQKMATSWEGGWGRYYQAHGERAYLWRWTYHLRETYHCREITWYCYLEIHKDLVGNTCNTSPGYIGEPSLPITSFGLVLHNVTYDVIDNFVEKYVWTVLKLVA